MMHTKEILAQLHGILKCNMALNTEDNICFYPETDEKHGLEGYNSWDVGAAGDNRVFYTAGDAVIDESALSLAILYLRSQMESHKTSKDFVLNILSGMGDYSDIAAVNQLIDKEKALYLITVGGADTTGIKSELLEIIKNSLEVKHICAYQENLIALVEAQDIIEACGDLQKNILTELYVETVVAIGGCLERPQQLTELYNNCIQVMLLKQSYGLNQQLLDYQSMLIYRLVSSIDKGLKDSIVSRIFSSRFIELLNSEMEQTIEEMFKNNLNLTDTSSRLYIHRNTLLYRIDKIYKLTGFDLRRFEDSMIFKLAWLMYKEKMK